MAKKSKSNPALPTVRADGSPLRAAPYLRVSTKRQADGEVSIPSQRVLCEKFCADHGYTLAREYVDAASGTSDEARPQFRRMLAACRTGFKNLALSGIFAGLGA